MLILVGVHADCSEDPYNQVHEESWKHHLPSLASSYYPSISQLPWHKMYVLKTAQKAVCETNLSISERSIMYTTIHLLLIYIKVHFKKVGGGAFYTNRKK